MTMAMPESIDGTSEAVRMTAADFVEGIAMELAERGYERVDVASPQFHAGMSNAFEQVFQDRVKYSLNLRFRIRPNAFHGDSATVRDAVTALAAWGRVSLDNPKCRYMRYKGDAETRRKRLAAHVMPPELRKKATQKFLEAFGAS